MGQVQEFFCRDARDEQGHLLHAPDCDHRNCFVVQGKKQETNTGSKPKMPDHYRCTFTCAFCGKRKHYEDECYHKQRLSAKPKGEDPGKGSGKGGGKGKDDSGKGKSKGRGKGQEKGQGGRGGGAHRHQDNRTRITRTGTSPGETPTPLQGGTPSPLEGLPQDHRRKPSKNKGLSVEVKVEMMASPRRGAASCGWPASLGNKGFEVTCPAEL